MKVYDKNGKELEVNEHQANELLITGAYSNQKPIKISEVVKDVDVAPVTINKGKHVVGKHRPKKNRNVT